MFLAFPTSSLKKIWQNSQQSTVIHPPALLPSRIPGRQHRALPAIGGKRWLCRCGHSSLASRPPSALVAQGHPAAHNISSAQLLRGSLPGAAAHQHPAPLTLRAALNAKHGGRVLKTKFCRALLRLGMTFVNERAFWTLSSLSTCLRPLSRKAKQSFDKYW